MEALIVFVTGFLTAAAVTFVLIAALALLAVHLVRRTQHPLYGTRWQGRADDEDTP